MILATPQYFVKHLVQEVLVAIIDALPAFRGDCTLLHRKQQYGHAHEASLDVGYGLQPS